MIFNRSKEREAIQRLAEKTKELEEKFESLNNFALKTFEKIEELKENLGNRLKKQEDLTTALIDKLEKIPLKSVCKKSVAYVCDAKNKRKCGYFKQDDERPITSCVYFDIHTCQCENSVVKKLADEQSGGEGGGV